jgi:hypothetical protein
MRFHPAFLQSGKTDWWQPVLRGAADRAQHTLYKMIRRASLRPLHIYFHLFISLFSYLFLHLPTP